jgi:hypothetical protein
LLQEKDKKFRNRYETVQLRASTRGTDTIIAHMFDYFNTWLRRKRKRPPSGSRCKGSGAANQTNPT